MKKINTYITEKLNLSKVSKYSLENSDEYKHLLYELECVFDSNFLYADDDYRIDTDDNNGIIHIIFIKKISDDLIKSLMHEIIKKLNKDTIVYNFCITHIKSKNNDEIKIHSIDFK